MVGWGDIVALQRTVRANRKARAIARARLGLDTGLETYLPEEMAAAVEGSPGGVGVELTAAKTQHGGSKCAARKRYK